ncbi:unnamed protein product [Urochloa decumbens]|uniref:Uncharacterized protein n=1 Tax=Urochloa decumbens TaxID=240449 RepID=A0ABC9C5E0_9POAL
MARSGSGERKRRLVRSLHYDCVERFRLRRLLAYLRHYRYDGAFQALFQETAVLFRPDHLQRLVRRGLSSDAVEYVHSFAPPTLRPRSAKYLVKFLRVLSPVVDSEDASAYEYDPYNPVQIHLYGRANPGGVKLAEVISSLRTEQARIKAAEIVGRWVAQIPEFNEMCRLPRCAGKPANVLPVRLSSWGHSRALQKKSLGRMPANALARSFLSKKRLHSSNQEGTGLPLKPFTMTQLAALIDECLQAGRCQVANANERTIENSYTEGRRPCCPPPRAGPAGSGRRLWILLGAGALRSLSGHLQTCPPLLHGRR